MRNAACDDPYSYQAPIAPEAQARLENAKQPVPAETSWPDGRAPADPAEPPAAVDPDPVDPVDAVPAQGGVTAYAQPYDPLIPPPSSPLPGSPTPQPESERNHGVVNRSDGTAIQTENRPVQPMAPEPLPKLGGDDQYQRDPA